MFKMEHFHPKIDEKKIVENNEILTKLSDVYACWSGCCKQNRQRKNLSTKPKKQQQQ